jgi:hypothetical protein
MLPTLQIAVGDGVATHESVAAGVGGPSGATGGGPVHWIAVPPPGSHADDVAHHQPDIGIAGFAFTATVLVVAGVKLVRRSHGWPIPGDVTRYSRRAG